MQNNEDYWLLSDADVSITDMWKTDSILLKCLSLRLVIQNITLFVSSVVCCDLNSFTAAVEWNGMDMLSTDFGTGHVSTPGPQTRPCTKYR